MSGLKSRAKGAAGELEACRAMEAVSGIPWRRTAQRWGKAKADIEPCEPGPAAQLHVEVKRRNAGFKWWLGRLEKEPDRTHLDDAAGLFFCRLEAIQRAAAQEADYLVAPNQCRPMAWMRQAEADAEPGQLPVLLIRQDRHPWIVAWRYADDDRLMALVRSFQP